MLIVAKSSSSLRIQTTSLLQVFVFPTLPDVRHFDVDPTLMDVDGNVMATSPVLS